MSLAPGTDTIEPADVELGQVCCGITLSIPIIAAAMDAVVDPLMAGTIAGLGGLAILNLEGVQTRYDDPASVLDRIAAAPDDEVQDLLAAAYSEPVREELIAARIDEIHAAGSKAAVAATPGAARRFGLFSAEHGADLEAANPFGRAKAVPAVRWTGHRNHFRGRPVTIVPAVRADLIV